MHTGYQGGFDREWSPPWRWLLLFYRNRWNSSTVSLRMAWSSLNHQAPPCNSARTAQANNLLHPEDTIFNKPVESFEREQSPFETEMRVIEAKDLEKSTTPRKHAQFQSPAAPKRISTETWQPRSPREHHAPSQEWNGESIPTANSPASPSSPNGTASTPLDFLQYMLARSVDSPSSHASVLHRRSIPNTNEMAGLLSSLPSPQPRLRLSPPVRADSQDREA
jgi:hypothetical protein